MLVQAGEAAAAAGDPARAEAGLRSALDLVPAGPTTARALLALGEIVYVTRPAEALPLLLAALDHTDGDPILEATAHSYIAGMADMDPHQANLSAERAALILERPDVRADPDHLACALLERAFIALRGEPAAAEDLDRGLRPRTGAGPPLHRTPGPGGGRALLVPLRPTPRGARADEAEYRRLTDRGEFGLLPLMAQTLSVLTQLAGDWPAARGYANECLTSWPRVPNRGASAPMLARPDPCVGRPDAARAIKPVPALATQEAAGDRWEAVIFCALLGFVELSVPDPPAALGYLRRALAHADAIEVRLPTQFRFLGDLVEAATLAGELELAERVLAERLESAARRQPLPWTMAMAHRGRGLVATATGDVTGGLGQLDRAVSVFDTALPCPFERGRTPYTRGQTHRRAGHRRSARADLEEACRIFSDLGARAWLSRATAELGRIGGRSPIGSTLSTSERHVAERAAAGLSNREIAAELMVSIRTVESQLSAVFRKLDVRSRGQLAAALRAKSTPGG